MGGENAEDYGRQLPMNEHYTFAAPWGPLLRGMTALSVGLLGTIFYIGISYGPPDSLAWDLVMIVVPVIILAVAVFFTIRGYVLYADTLFVKRLGWFSKIPLEGLQSAEADPQAMSRSIRRFGNGGMFCFAGWFKNKKLGPFRLFGMDLRRSVVLRFHDRVLVVTPDDPLGFVEKINNIRRSGQSYGPDEGSPPKRARRQ